MHGERWQRSWNLGRRGWPGSVPNRSSAHSSRKKSPSRTNDGPVLRSGRIIKRVAVQWYRAEQARWRSSSCGGAVLRNMTVVTVGWAEEMIVSGTKVLIQGEVRVNARRRHMTFFRSCLASSGVRTDSMQVRKSVPPLEAPNLHQRTSLHYATVPAASTSACMRAGFTLSQCPDRAGASYFASFDQLEGLYRIWSRRDYRISSRGRLLKTNVQRNRRCLRPPCGARVMWSI